jgi:hypothetical protein
VSTQESGRHGMVKSADFQERGCPGIEVKSARIQGTSAGRYHHFGW